MKDFLKNLKGTTAKSKPVLGFAVLVVGGVFAWYYLGTSEPPVNPSVINSSAMSQDTIHGTPAPIDPVYKEKLREADEQRAREAEEKGASAIPTVVGATTEEQMPLLELPSEMAETPEIEPPVAEIMQKPLALATPIHEPVPIVTAPPPTAATQDPELIARMAAAMARQPVATAAVVQFNPLVQAPAAEEQSAPEVGAQDAQPESKIKLPLAGTILYAQLVGRANSDHPGPVLAKILQGEYTGATLIGSFQVAQNALVISFDRMTVGTTRSGEVIDETVPIQATAVDTAYIGTGLATSVNRHLFQKLAIAFTAGFAQGFGDAISQTGETTIDTGNGTVTTGSKDLNADEELMVAGGNAVSEAGSILQQEFGNRPTTVIVEAGTPVGVLFLQ